MEKESKEEFFCKIDIYGDKYWYKNNELHRVEFANGTKQWYKNGELHREGGPAIECADGYKAWYLNGGLHRLDGPAIEFITGYKQYWYNDSQIDCSSDEEYKRLIRLKAFWK